MQGTLKEPTRDAQGIHKECSGSVWGTLPPGMPRECTKECKGNPKECTSIHMYMYIVYRT